ncbi:MAG: hypothetical protein QX191_08275 [Methylococcaceae bacterium]
MEQYSVFIIVLKEILEPWSPLKIGLIVVLAIMSYRLPDIITAIRWW